MSYGTPKQSVVSRDLEEARENVERVRPSREIPGWMVSRYLEEARENLESVTSRKIPGWMVSRYLEERKP